MDKEQIQKLLKGLEAQNDRPATPMTRHGENSKIYTKNTDTATHVYLRQDNPTGLQPRYHGPYLIKRRIGDTTIEVKTGTFKSGADRLEIHSWNNAKPANMGSAQVAERPKLGRPSKQVPSNDPSSPEVGGQLTTESSAVPSFPDSVKPVESKTKPVKTKPPAQSTHTMKLRNQK